MTLDQLVERARALVAKPKAPQPLKIGASIDLSTDKPVTDGPRAYIHTSPGMFVPLTMAGLAVSVDEGMADSILSEIERRLAAVEKDRTEFIEARRAQALQEHIKFHHPRIAREFERVSLVKRSLRIKPR